MLGIEDGLVVAAYLLCVGGTALCVVYGLVMWNRGHEADQAQTVDALWERQERKIEEEEGM